MNDLRREELRGLLAKAVRRGDFMLHSGTKTDWFLDAAQVAMSARGGELVAGLLIQEVPDLMLVRAVGGPSQGADPIAAAVAHRLRMNWFTIREGRRHRRLVGAVVPGDSVVVVDDVFTTGASLTDAIEVCTKAGIKVEGAACLVSRAAPEVLEDFKITHRIAVDILFGAGEVLE